MTARERRCVRGDAAARTDRDHVSSTALDASLAQGPRDFCEACQETIGRAASISPSCGCHFHARCAIGIVEDNLPNAMAYGHDAMPCPHYGQTSGHGFRATEVLTVCGSASLCENEAGQRAINARINTIRHQLQSLGSGARDDPLRLANTGTGERGADPPALSIYCLLYTSPSPRDATLSRMPSSA